MIKEFISTNQNDIFSSLRGIDLQDLLVQTENFFLEYRDTLNLPEDVTFGIEIEYENVLRIIVTHFVNKNLSEWISKEDGSLTSGGEITSPIMTDKPIYWQELKMICDYLTKKNADTCHNAGGHIHTGCSNLGNDVDAWRIFLKLYICYEHVLFRFMYGENISGRRTLLEFAPPVADKLYRYLDEIDTANDMHAINEALRFITYSKYYALNFDNAYFYDDFVKCDNNTLEYRGYNGCKNAVIWQNNINASTKMQVASRNKMMNEEFLDYKLEYEFNFYSRNNAYLYNEINLKDALEFCDLVFDNNLDKIYFLRQYLKSFQDNYGLKEAVKAKKFVRC